MKLQDFEEGYITLIKSTNKKFFDSIIKPELDEKFPDLHWKLSNEIDHTGKFNISGEYRNLTGYKIKIFYYITWLTIQCQFENFTEYETVSFRSQVFSSLSDCLEELSDFLSED